MLVAHCPAATSCCCTSSAPTVRPVLSALSSARCGAEPNSLRAAPSTARTSAASASKAMSRMLASRDKPQQPSTVTSHTPRCYFVAAAASRLQGHHSVGSPLAAPRPLAHRRTRREPLHAAPPTSPAVDISARGQPRPGARPRGACKPSESCCRAGYRRPRAGGWHEAPLLSHTPERRIRATPAQNPMVRRSRAPARSGAPAHTDPCRAG